MEIEKRNIKKHLLNFDQTLPYFLDHLGDGLTLAQLILKKTNFDQGVFYTLLPDVALLDRLYEFQWGGIIPPIPYGKKVYFIDNYPEGFLPQQVLTMDRACSKFMSDFIHISESHVAVVENSMLESQSYLSKIENERMIPYKTEVYYFLDKTNSTEQIYNTIRKSSCSWHSLFVLTNFKALLDCEELTINELDSICLNVNFVIVGAYDGEGFIFWQKNKSSTDHEFFTKLNNETAT